MSYWQHHEVLEYKGQKRVIQTLGRWCGRCGEAILAGEALLAHESAFQELQAKVETQRRGLGD